MPDSRARHWHARTAPEVSAADGASEVVVLPLAAIEQHGPHLPLSTDLDIGCGLLDRAFGLLPEDAPAWVLPPLAVGASGEHARTPGTLSVSAAHLVDSIRSVGGGLARSGIRRLVLANSHGGNTASMASAGLALRSEHDMLVTHASWFRLGRPEVELPDTEWKHGLHGGAVETAMMLCLRPDLVRRDRISRFESFGEELGRAMRILEPEGEAPFSWLAADLSELGVVGDATLATPDLGERLVEHYARALADVILDALHFPLDRLDRARVP